MKTLNLVAALLIGGFGFTQTSWYLVEVDTNLQLNTIEFATEDVGYIGGNDSLLLKTTDGGTTWSEVEFTGVTFFSLGEHIINLKFVSADEGFMTVGPYTGTYHTTDGGSSWEQVTVPGSFCYNQGLYFSSATSGFIGGSGCFEGEKILRYDAGSTTEMTINSSGLSAEERVSDIDFYGADFGLASSRSGRILRTTDGGDTWDSIPSGLPDGVPITAIEIINDTLAYAAYDYLSGSTGILRTTDAGLTWAVESGSALSISPSYLCVHEAASGYVFSGGEADGSDEGVILERDLTGSWGVSSVDEPIRAMTHSQSNVVWGVGDSGYVVVNTPPGGLNITTEKEKTLAQPYPNPTAGSVHFSETIRQLTVYSAMGELILQTENVNEIDLGSDGKGVYFLHADTEVFRVVVK